MKRLFFLLILFIVAFVPTSCKHKEAQTVAEGPAQTYTCPMHPQIVQHAPGTCPICGMDLVPFDKNNKDATLTLSESQQLLANIVTDTVRSGTFSSIRQLNGRIAINPESVEMVSSRVGGRLETMAVRETGVSVKKGQALYTIYSEQLAALQQEYIVAIAQAAQFPGDGRFQQIAEGAKQRLMLFDQSTAQIAQLEKGKKVSPYVTYTAPAGGVVSELYAVQGQYVGEGAPIMRIEGYGTVWVEADVYPNEAGSVQEGQTVTVRVPGYEQQAQSMRIQFIAPSLQGGSQLLTVRGQIANPGNQYRAGMQALIDVPVTNISDAITLPVDAVIRDERGSHVWVETAPGKFKARSIRTGAENFNRVEVLDGLDAGEIAVVSGAYLLYSEFVLKRGTSPIAATQPH